MTYSCCCGPESPVNDARLSSACFCQKCPSEGTYTLCLAGLTVNDVPPVTAPPGHLYPEQYPCPGFKSLGYYPIVMSRKAQGSDAGWIHTPLRNHYCNCAFAGDSLPNKCLSGPYRTPDERAAFGESNGAISAWLELEELCLDHDPNNIGHLKRGIREDMNCAGENFSVDITGTVSGWVSGWPCSPCYNNSHRGTWKNHSLNGNIFGSINYDPFTMECGDEFEQYVNVSPVCPAGSNVTPSSWDLNVPDGTIDQCINSDGLSLIADQLDGKYFWITDDVGDKFHVWFIKVKKDGEGNIIEVGGPDPDPSGSSGGIKIPLMSEFEGFPESAEIVKNCSQLRDLIREAIKEVEETCCGHAPGGVYPKKWLVDRPSLGSFDDPADCNPSSVVWPDNLCTFCVTANKTFRQNGNQAVTVYDGNTGFEFGDGGADEIVGGMGHCCAGPAPRLFVSVPTMKETTLLKGPDPVTGIWPWIKNIGGTAVSDCQATDPFCICAGAQGEEGANPGDPPVITNYGVNNYELYEYGLNGDFDCFGCNVFSLRSRTGAALSDTSHITLPNDVKVCPSAGCVKKIGFLILIDSDYEYGCPDSQIGGTWNTGSCLFDADAANIQNFIDKNPHLEVRIQVIKTKGSENLAVPYTTGSWCNGECYNHGALCHALRYDRNAVVYGGFGAQCSCHGIPAGINGITGGGGGGGSLPMGLMELDNCPEVDHDPDMYGWNKDPCCRPASWAVPGVANCPTIRQVAGQDPECWGFPPGGPGCQCCCEFPRNWRGLRPSCETPAECHPRCYENLCLECYPKEANKLGTFQAGCSRVTAADIEAAWQSLTSGGTWIPDDFKFLIDTDIAGMNGKRPGNYDDPDDPALCEYIENYWQYVCLNGRWTPATFAGSSGFPHAGHAPIITQVCGIGDEITNGLMAILDSVEQSGQYTTLGGDCDVPNYTVEYPFRIRWGSGDGINSGPIGVKTARWLDQVAQMLVGYSCEEFYVEPDCPEREPVYISTFFNGDNPASFFDCPPWMPAPCWVAHDHPTLGSAVGAASGWQGLKKAGPYSCRRTGERYGYYHRSSSCSAAEYRLDRIELDEDRLRQHPLNSPDGFGFFVGAPLTNISRCPCCYGCDVPLSDASFTINSSSDCWGINHLNGERTEDKKPLGGTFTLSPVEGECAWGAEFPNSFIDYVYLRKWSLTGVGGVGITGTAGLRLTLYHGGSPVEIYELYDPDIDGSPVEDWACSGEITLPKKDRGELGWPTHGIHVCDPCSWDHENYAFALFNLNRGQGIDPDRVDTFNNATIKLTSTDGTERTYTLKIDGSADPNLLEFNWDLALGPAGTDGAINPNTFRNFKTVVESSAGHDGKIIVDISGGFLTALPYGVIKLIQSEKGPAGETDIIYSREFRDWCREGREYSANIGGVPPCPDKFEGGDWCMYLNPFTNIMEPRCRKFTTHPNSWPHDCPCTMKGVSFSCLPETITVTI